MAAEMTIEEHILRHFGGFELNSPLHLLNEEHSHLEQGMLDVLQLSPYTDEYSLTSVIKFKQHDFKIIKCLNCQSHSANIDNLKIVII